MNGYRQFVSNYSPISVLPIISKITGICNNRLYKFLGLVFKGNSVFLTVNGAVSDYKTVSI